MEPISDLNVEDTKTAARQSILMNPNVVRKLLSIANTSEENGFGKLSPLTVRSLVSSINRGLLYMIESLELEYLDFLRESPDLFDDLISYFVMVSGQSSIPFDELLRTTTQKNM